MKKLKSIYNFFSPKKQSLFLEYKVEFKPRYGHGKPPHTLLNELINSNRNIYVEILNEIVKDKTTFQKIKKQKYEISSIEPVYNNGYLPALDIFTLFTIIKKYKPKTYVEVGSGNSTKLAYKAIQTNGLNTKIISIDPYPRAEIDQLVDQIMREPFENINYDFILNLKENDILFIDNSHRILPNSDAMVLFLEVLPRLAKGVLVHIHDVYLPFDYPQFMCDRFYSEQYGLAILLMANPQRYQAILPVYFVSQDKELSSIIEQVWENDNLKDMEKHGGSFWLQIC